MVTRLAVRTIERNTVRVIERLMIRVGINVQRGISGANTITISGVPSIKQRIVESTMIRAIPYFLITITTLVHKGPCILSRTLLHSVMRMIAGPIAQTIHVIMIDSFVVIIG